MWPARLLWKEEEKLRSSSAIVKQKLDGAQKLLAGTMDRVSLTKKGAGLR